MASFLGSLYISMESIVFTDGSAATGSLSGGFASFSFPSDRVFVARDIQRPGQLEGAHVRLVPMPLGMSCPYST
ncbi:hypothetical protein [Caballeronia sp. S22]|uniref:hypothetical protein n=1 Tax=Caballeronia sp. S22 TaxID=3137182 RepID=UPI0035312F4D